jgi:hypothetical protein
VDLFTDVLVREASNGFRKHSEFVESGGKLGDNY